MNTKLHAITDANDRPLSFFMTAGQISDYTAAAALLDELPKAKWLPDRLLLCHQLAATVILWL